MLDQSDKKWIIEAIQVGTSKAINEVVRDVVMPGFEILHKDIVNLDKRVSVVEKKLDVMEDRFEAVDRRFDEMDGRFDQIDRKLMNITDHQAVIINSHEKRITKLEVSNSRKKEIRAYA